MFIASIVLAAIKVPIARPRHRNTSASDVTRELIRGARFTALLRVLIGAVFTVFIAITFPVLGDTQMAVTLELISCA